MRALTLALAIAGFAQLAAAQTLSVKGPAGSVTLTAAEIAEMPRRASFLFDAHGQKHTYEGPLLIDVLARAGTPTGKDLRGAALANAVVARASDGYTVVYGLGELDPGRRPNRIILADRADGRPLDAKDGPFKIVVEGDLRPARGARMMREIEVLPLGGTAGAPHPH
jgi:hypothetical protein